MPPDSSSLDARPWTRLLLAALLVVACLALAQATAAPLPLPVLALYQRITPAKSTAHAHRAALLDLARAEPGILMGEAATRLRTTFKSAQHHARVLQRCRLLDVVKVGRNVALYPPGCVSHQQRAALVHLRRGPQAQMLDTVANHPGLRVGELAELAGCKKSSASAKLKRLRGLGLVASVGGSHRVTPAARDAWSLLPRQLRLRVADDQVAPVSPLGPESPHDDPAPSCRHPPQPDDARFEAPPVAAGR